MKATGGRKIIQGLHEAISVARTMKTWSWQGMMGEMTEETQLPIEMKLPAKIGRPSKYTPELAADICQRIAAGAALYKICEEAGMPCESMVYNWLIAHASFRELYARARGMQADRLFDQITEMAHAATPKSVNVQRLKVDAHKFVVARLAPHKYGDRILNENVQLDANGQPMTPVFSVNVLTYSDK